MKPKVSIIILNFNGRKHLKRCLLSLSRRNYKNIEIIVVDNGSTDESQAFIKTYYPEVELIENKTNVIPLAANRGARRASGKYLLFLDNDTQVDKGFLAHLVESFEREKSVGLAQSKIMALDNPEIIQSVGCFFSFSGFYWHEASGEKDVGKFLDPREIFSTAGGCYLIPKDVFEEVGGFDETCLTGYFDIDLSYIILKQGYRVILVPGSVVYHKGGGTSKGLSRDSLVFRGFRNSICVLLKDLDLRYLPFVLFLHISICLGGGLVFLLRLKFSYFLAAYKGILWNLTHLPFILRQREAVQKKRIVSDQEIFKRFARRLFPPLPYVLIWIRKESAVFGGRGF